VVCPTPPQQIVFQEYLRAVNEQQERRQRMERELHEAVKGWRLYPVVEAIQALRGVELTGAVILMTELGDLTRFDNPRQLMSYLGLTPSEYSSGERRRQGGITKAGNSHARRALVEGRGPIGIRPRSVAICSCVWRSSRPRSRRSAGRRRCACADGIGS